MRRLSPQQREALRWDWRFWARPNQLPPEGDWTVWLAMAGRGFGKTRMGAEWVRARVTAGVARHVALIAQTPGDARDVMLHGPSGLLSVGPEVFRPRYEPSKLLLTWPNGAIGHVRSGAEPDKIRGLNVDTAWCDELASWQYPRETWDLLQFALRVGDPRACITTTPKPLMLLKEIMGASGTVLTHGTTYENLANLAPKFFRDITTKYEGTTLGQQELYAALLEEAAGALWTRAILTASRRKEATAMKRIVVAVDPAISAKGESNETGIVVAGRGTDDHGYVLRDLSGRYGPATWADRVIQAYRDSKADRIVAEANQGGDMVSHTLRTVDPKVPIRLVHASQGKRTRAEPVAALFEQDRAHMVGSHPALEDQLATWEPLGNLPSPDRLDAMVWALTDLCLDKQAPRAMPGAVDQPNYWTVA